VADTSCLGWSFTGGDACAASLLADRALNAREANLAIKDVSMEDEIMH